MHTIKLKLFEALHVNRQFESHAGTLFSCVLFAKLREFNETLNIVRCNFRIWECRFWSAYKFTI